MQGQSKQPHLPLSARNPLSHTRRTHSQPHCHLRHQNKIKINLKRLPTDFFHPALPEIPLREATPKYRAATQQIRPTEEKQLCLLARLGSSQNHREGTRLYRSQKRKRIVSQHSMTIQQPNENSNQMNWTFSRQMFSKEGQQGTLSPKIRKGHTEEGIHNSEAIKHRQRSRSRNKGEAARGAAGDSRVNNILTDKLCELNLNRLKMNLRKNNHPQSYLQYVKRLCV